MRWLILMVTMNTTAATLTYAPAPVLNPMKGFVPYQSDGSRNTFPHSLSFMYFSLRDLMTNLNTFTWTPLDDQIQAAMNDHCQFIFRVYLDFPTKAIGIPQYLLDGGLSTCSYSDFGNSTSVSPDYTDANLQTALTNFIAALGARYDGDSRIAAITAGLLGVWGEWWHPSCTYATTEVENKVVYAFTNAFKTTQILLRNPYTQNANLPVGYHDDSFCNDTVAKVFGSGFMLYMTNAGALQKWTTNMIGGEVYPDYWSCLFDASPCGVDPYNLAVTTTHASWLMDSGAFDSTPPENTQRTLDGSRLLGYELHVPSWSWSGNGLTVSVTNTGVAPFYYPWTMQAVVGSVTSTVPLDIRAILPGQSTNVTTTLNGVGSGIQSVLMRVINPMPGGVVFSFANSEMDTNGGWLTLGSVGTPQSAVGSMVVNQLIFR